MFLTETTSQLELPAEAMVLVLSDLHLSAVPTPESDLLGRELAARLEQLDGPGAVVLNGDLLEIWGEPGRSVGDVLRAHPLLVSTLSSFAAGPGRYVVLVVGNHDARLAWDDEAAATVAELLGCRLTLQLDLALDTPAGRRMVRCEHGHGFDPANALRDPRNPLDSPLGQHVVREILPRFTRNRLFADLGSLADADSGIRFIASRLAYRLLGSRIWWLLVPVLLSITLRAPFLVSRLAGSDELRRLPSWLFIVSVALAVNVFGLLVAVGFLVRSLYTGMTGTGRWNDPLPANGAPRAAAAALCRQGYAGMITGHTHHPELTPVQGGFYANTGCALHQVDQHPARLGLPPVFVPVRRMSWIELDVVRDLRIRLLLSELPSGARNWLERLARRGALPNRPTMELVAELPSHAGYPVRSLDLTRRAAQERARSRAALVVGAVAVLSLGSALTSPFQDRVRDLLDLMPIGVPQFASAAVAFVSVALLLLGRGLRRGHLLAWRLAVGLLGVTLVLHLLKGLDVEEALLTALTMGWLIHYRDAFPVRPGGPTWRWPGAVLVGSLGALAVSIAGVLVVRASALPDALAVPGLLGLPGLLANRPFLTPTLLTTAFAGLVGLGLFLTRTRRERHRTPGEHVADRERARALIERHGGDTLAFFALRDDKSWFFAGDCVVAYAVRDGVCLVSPDPIGPAEQWASVWADFTEFADRHGWPVAVLGAGSGWLPIYQAAGLRPMYMGDEAIVDCTRFTLEGRPMKGLRSACQRVRRAGYTIGFHDPAALPAPLAEELRDLLAQSRHGQVERGFSMTLSRIFEPADTGMLLAVAYRPDGRAAGFCQFVPAADIAGWSLDLMRRAADPELPNGLTDFILVETIEHARRTGCWGLSLNFAVMRAVLSGEQGDGIVNDLQAWVLNRFSESMQIASLWKYNRKFQPIWRPRYVAAGRLSAVPAQGLAIATAEGVTELPLIGRLVGRSQHKAANALTAESSPTDASGATRSREPVR